MNRTISGICSIALCLFLAASLGAQGRDHSTNSQARKTREWHAMGSSPCAWYQPSGSVESTARELQSLGFKCGVFVIQGAGGYESYQKFLEATKDTDIQIWAVIIPPSEGASSLPYRSDYIAWSRELAKLSLKYKNFRGFNIDDLDQGESPKTFTKNYVCEIYRAKKGVNPRLLFVPTVYDLDRPTADRLAGCVDGVWLWWVNLEKATGLPSFLENSRYAANGRFPIYGGVYAHWTSWHKAVSPLPDVFQETLDDTCKYSDGAVIWQLSLSPADPLLAITKKFFPGGTSPYAGKCGTSAPAGGH